MSAIVNIWMSGDVKRAELKIPCPLGKTSCGVPVVALPHTKERCWSWDGNEATPTVTPSVWCQVEGCGFHKTLSAGVWNV